MLEVRGQLREPVLSSYHMDPGLERWSSGFLASAIALPLQPGLLTRGYGFASFVVVVLYKGNSSEMGKSFVFVIPSNINEQLSELCRPPKTPFPSQ